ncbi:NAD-dependent epimerase/dehydratase family protein [Streptomyces lavendofoliae]|uniref:UDP-glucose epimerase YtcB n=1 Tax=Streptomyces lavendofoliae TaxID=67314 RepID=A0A918HX68_9ACTN|nr:NAD-dependent epimerase/dehydratase family protein [Streptomyces lavendofoliae]GGU39981.1 putative UDP-glucose epimerase YtcB [Streptomyces lavendofoliae]
MPSDAYLPAIAGDVVVTGAAGFIGSHLVSALRHSGRNVTGVDRRDMSVHTESGPAPGEGAFQARTGDLATMDLGSCLKGVDLVFHLAALPGVRPSWTEFPEYLHCNVLATQRLLDACVQAGVGRVVMASSSSVYGGAEGAMHEEMLPRPSSPYGVTKLAAERLALAFAARRDTALSVAALRFFTVYGPGQRPDMFISRMIRAVLLGRPVEVYGDGTQIRDFVYVEDVVRALLLAAAPGRPRGDSATDHRTVGDQAVGDPADDDRAEVLNVGTGSSVSLNRLLELTAELTGLRPDARYGPTRVGDVGATTADPGRTRERLGFRPATDLRTGLAAQIEWTRRRLDPAHRPDRALGGTATGRRA